MKPFWMAALVLGGALTPCLAQLPQLEPAREWKPAEGAPFQAALAGFDGTTATLRLANGTRLPMPAAKLSAGDQQYLAAWQERQPIKVVMPDTAGVDMATLKLEVVSEDPAGQAFVYRTPHFEFVSQGKFTQSLLREVGRDFEATYELVKALPWNISPQPENGATHFKARLLKDMDAYHAAGGPPNSGGVYDSGKALFMVPFECIGVRVIGKSFAKDEGFNHRTMVHELTHQMMHSRMAVLPQWMLEGTAEYTANLPLKNGRFRVSGAKNALKDYLDSMKGGPGGALPEPYPLEDLFNVSNAEWNRILGANPQMSHRLYYTSYLLVYYFMHLDGAGDGQRIVRYLRSVAAAQKGAHRPLDQAEETRLRQILLDGRTEAELMKQIRSGYVRMGVRL